MRCISFIYGKQDPIKKLRERKNVVSSLLSLNRNEVLKGIALGYIPIFLNIDKYFAENMFVNLTVLRSVNNHPICLNFFPDTYQLASYRHRYPGDFIAVRLEDISPSNELFERLIGLVDLLIIDQPSIYDDRVADYQSLIKKKIGESEVFFANIPGLGAVSG